MTDLLKPYSSIQNLNGYVALDDLSVIEATGSDALHFLHHQLTQDLLLLPEGQGRLAAYCSAKGRILVSFYILKINPEKVLLVCKKDAIESSIKRLKMFVLRAKVQLRDASADYPVWGVIGQSVGTIAQQEQWPDSPWHTMIDANANANTAAIRLYAAGALARAVVVGQLPAKLQEHSSLISKKQWDLAHVLAAVPLIGQTLADAFVPQMINYESVGGVNFKKGCYPGQEVVARSQFRGTLKRRMYLCSSANLAVPGQELFLSTEPDQTCGVVVEAALFNQETTSTCFFLASLQISAAEQAGASIQEGKNSILGLLHSTTQATEATSQNSPLLSDTSHQQEVKIWPLPYELLKDI